MSKPETQPSYPPSINSPARRALYDNLKDVEGLAELVVTPKDWVGESATDIAEAAALAVDTAIRNVKKDDWRSTKPKRTEVRIVIKSVLGDEDLVDRIFEIVKNQRDY